MRILRILLGRTNTQKCADSAYYMHIGFRAKSAYGSGRVRCFAYFGCDSSKFIALMTWQCTRCHTSQGIADAARPLVPSGDLPDSFARFCLVRPSSSFMTHPKCHGSPHPHHDSPQTHHDSPDSVTTMSFGPTGFKRTRSYFGLSQASHKLNGGT